MNFLEIAARRQSCRSYDPDRPVEEEKITAILEAARLAPSACNGQPYHFTVCRGETAQKIAATLIDGKLNRFVPQAPVLIVISEEPYVKLAALGAKLKNNDYRSIDIGIVAAYLTAEAEVQGLGSCILGWLDSNTVCKLCGLKQSQTVRLIISLGYAKEGDPIRTKKRKDLSELVTYLD